MNACLLHNCWFIRPLDLWSSDTEIASQVYFQHLDWNKMLSYFLKTKRVHRTYKKTCAITNNFHFRTSPNVSVIKYVPRLFSSHSLSIFILNCFMFPPNNLMQNNNFCIKCVMNLWSFNLSEKLVKWLRLWNH